MFIGLGDFSSYSAIIRGILTRLVNILANATCFQDIRVFANPAQDSLFHLSSLLRAFPAPTLRCCLGGFFYFSSCYRGRAFISTVSSPKTTRSLGNSSRTQHFTLLSKPLSYNTVSLRLVSCY